MPLAEAVTIEVGAAIAKSIFKLWLKDSQLGGDISSSLIDLLKTKTSDALAQRRGQRQFDIIRLPKHFLILLPTDWTALRCRFQLFNNCLAMPTLQRRPSIPGSLQMILPV